MQNTCFFAEHTFVLEKIYNHICSASPTKKGPAPWNLFLTRAPWPYLGEAEHMRL
jgi:hypothetical protein